MHRMTASLLAVGLFAASALAEVPATKTPPAAPPVTSKATATKTDKLAAAKKRPATHRHHKRHPASKPAPAPVTK